jgi:hypothetical protein
MPSTSSATSTTTIASMPAPRYDWELFWNVYVFAVALV